MRKGQVKTAWNGMCTKLHNNLKGDVAKKVDAYKELCGDLPRKLPTLAAFKSSVQGAGYGTIGFRGSVDVRVLYG